MSEELTNYKSSNLPKIISLSGYKGSGKDAVFKELSKYFPGHSFERLAWADSLKNEVYEIFDIPLDLLHADEETKNNTITKVTVFSFVQKASYHTNGNPKVKNNLWGILKDREWGDLLTVREILQYWGTEVRRAQDPDYWVKQVIPTLDTPNLSVFVLTDTRFDNEIAAIHERQGISIWLDRKQKDKKETHSSEKCISDQCMHSVKSRGYQSLNDTMSDIAKILLK